jgi:hypothetical protein
LTKKQYEQEKIKNKIVHIFFGPDCGGVRRQGWLELRDLCFCWEREVCLTEREMCVRESKIKQKGIKKELMDFKQISI